MPSKLMRPPPIPLLGNTQLNTLTLGQANPRLLGAHNENVALARRELIVDGVLDVHDVEAAIVALAVRHHAHAPHVATARGHGDAARVELDVVGDFASGEVDLDGVVDADLGVWVADAVGTSVSVGLHNMRLFGGVGGWCAGGWWVKVLLGSQAITSP